MMRSSVGTPVPFQGAQFKFLSANVVDTASGKTLFAPYGIKVMNGVRVGFIFKSPTDPHWYQSAFPSPTPPSREQWALFSAALGLPEDEGGVQGCEPAANWKKWRRPFCWRTEPNRSAVC